jgi:hypothetical protein
MNRKILLLGCASLASVALAAPAAASASVWQHEGAPLEEHVEIGLVGGEVFVTQAGAMICNVHATLTTEGGEMGEITSFEATKCMGLFGELQECTLTSAEQAEGPWTVDVNAEDLTITDVAIHRTFAAGCPIETLDSQVAEVTTTLNEPAAIAELEYSAEGTSSADGGPEGEYSVFGSFAVEGEASGTYGIG